MTNPTPVISLIAAMDNNRLIGVNNTLPWKLPADMKWFVENTKHKPIVVGRKTWESFGSRPLKDRSNIVISRNPDYKAKGATVVTSPVMAIYEAINAPANKSGKNNEQEVMVIGGASFYEHFMPIANRLYITRIQGEFEGDAWFPEIDENLWQQTHVEHHKADRKNSHDYSFYIYQRKS